MTTKPTEVVVAVAFDKDGRFLMTSRPEGKVYAGYWEFPGGKQEAGETVEQCIVREIREELGVCCRVGNFLMSTSKAYPHGEFKSMFYRAELDGTAEPQPLVHQELRWVRPEELAQYAFPPADVEIINFLRGTPEN